MVEKLKTTLDERQLVIFSLANEEFGVDIDQVREIIHMEDITRVPHTPDYIKGIINLRGGIIVVVDLSKKLGLETKKSDLNSRIIVIEVNGSTIGMIVDSATEVLRLSKDQIKPAPEVIKKKINATIVRPAKSFSSIEIELGFSIESIIVLPSLPIHQLLSEIWLHQSVL